MIRIIFSLIVLAAFNACAPAQHGGGLAGRYERLPGPGALEKVAYYVSRTIDAATAQKYVLYRCAEIAKEKNKQHFWIFDSLASAALKMPSELPAVGTLHDKSMAVAFVLVLDDSRFGSKETEKVLGELGPIVQRKKPLVKGK